ncbi:MAG: TonB-dependent receptor, partial [Bacteroidota bacterium]
MKNTYTSSFLLFLCLVFSYSLLAQRPPGGGNWGGARGGGPKIKGTIKGKVFDEDEETPVEFATVVLLAPGGQKQINGLVTEPDGSFKLTDVPAGKYWLQISFIGYEELTIQDIETTPKKPDLDLKKIQLAKDAEVLETVEVTGEAALVENRIDKLVYNADKDATNTGGDASDVLRKVPLLSVDLEGNVSLRGSSNIQVLVNGRPSSIFAASVADALKTIPSDQIKTVEVITTPSARYDGEGSGGIINIITKKKEAKGFTGTVNSSIGTRQNNAGLNVNALVGRFGLNGGVNGFWSWDREGNNSFNRVDFDDAGQTIRNLNQAGTNGNRVVGINGSGGAFYDFNAYNSINFSGRYNSFQRFGDNTINGSLLNLGSEAINFGRFSENENLRSGFDLTLDYKKTYPDQKDKELIFAFQVSGNDSEAANTVDQFGDIERYQE